MCSVRMKVMWRPDKQRSSASLNMEFTGPCNGRGKMRTWGGRGFLAIGGRLEVW